MVENSGYADFSSGNCFLYVIFGFTITHIMYPFRGNCELKIGGIAKIVKQIINKKQNLLRKNKQSDRPTKVFKIGEGDKEGVKSSKS